MEKNIKKQHQEVILRCPEKEVKKMPADHQTFIEDYFRDNNEYNVYSITGLTIGIFYQNYITLYIFTCYPLFTPFQQLGITLIRLRLGRQELNWFIIITFPLQLSPGFFR